MECGNSSVVEHRLAKARVGSSNLLSRSNASHSSSGPGHRPFTAGTGVRTPYGTPLFRRDRQYRKSGNSSVVEHRLAKARVGSSNLLSRSNLRCHLSVLSHYLLYYLYVLSLRTSLRFTSHSSSGPGHRPFTAGTGVRTPYGTPFLCSFSNLLPSHSILFGIL